MNLEAALKYAALGWPVFPVWWPDSGGCACGKPNCQSPAKHPLGVLAPHGLKDAIQDLEVIKGWWRRYPQANIGVVTGPDNGLVVLDLDPRNGGHPDRLPGNLPLTPTVNTGGGGWHFYLAHSDGFKFPKELPGCKGTDLKAAGGYVVAPPSLHISGERYIWQISPETTPLAHCPAWFLNMAKRPEPRSMPQPISAQPGTGSAYGRAALRGELTRLAQTLVGERNNALNKVAFSLGRLIAAGHLDEDTVVHLVTNVAANIGLGEGEIRATVRSGLRAGLIGGVNLG
jgi:hypothetical protein